MRIDSPVATFEFSHCIQKQGEKDGPLVTRINTAASAAASGASESKTNNLYSSLHRHRTTANSVAPNTTSGSKIVDDDNLLCNADTSVLCYHYWVRFLCAERDFWW